MIEETGQPSEPFHTLDLRYHKMIPMNTVVLQGGDLFPEGN